MKGMSLASIIDAMDEVTEKVANVQAKPATKTKVASAQEELTAALRRVEESTKTAAAKTASKGNPVGDLEKMASDLATADQEALVKEANLYGAAICDGFMSRLTQFESAYNGMPGTEKTASHVDIEKVASEAIRGYVDTQDMLKVAAEREYIQGYNDTMGEITKIASDVFSKGAADCGVLLKNLK